MSKLVCPILISSIVSASIIMCSTWQDDSNGAVGNKFNSVTPGMGDWQSSYRRCRKGEIVLCRARIGHTHLTHSHISTSVGTLSVYSDSSPHFGGVQ